MSSVPPFPPSGEFLKSIRSSCRLVREAAGIEITAASIERLLRSPAFTSSFHRVSKAHGLAFPFKFPSHLAELNLLSTLSLLNFASGYRGPLHSATGRGAWDNIRALVFAMYLSSSVGEDDYMSAKGMKAVNYSKIAEFMRVPIHVEKPHDKLQAVIVGELGGPLFELVKLVEKTLNETGEALLNGGYPDLGKFVAEALQEGAKAGDKAVEVILERLSRAIPGFRDMALVNGQPVYCFKKALFLIHAISIRFADLSPPPFPVPSTNNIPVFTDNVLPSMLVHLGILGLPTDSELSRHFPTVSSSEALEALLRESPDSGNTALKDITDVQDGAVLTSSEAYILRAAAIDACELIVATAHNMPEDLYKHLCLADLDMWLWAVAKDRPDYRALPRFVLTDTVFF